MGVRPSKTVRNVKAKQIWTRISQKRPRKSYIKGAPRPKVRQYHMGADRYYELEVDLVSEQDINVRDNSLESARQATNKYLENHLMVQNFYLTLLKYPHSVIREHTALGVAGADRISKGMKQAFGSPKGRMARVNRGEAIFRVRVMAKSLPVVKKALTMGMLKMSGRYDFRIKDITKDPANMAKSKVAVKLFKKKETAEDKKKAEEAAAEAAAAAASTATAGAEGAKPEAGKAGAPAAADAKKPATAGKK